MIASTNRYSGAGSLLSALPLLIAMLPIEASSQNAAARVPGGGAAHAAAGGWVVPRTVFGHPDLQGNWTNATLTPTQRPASAGPTIAWEQVNILEGRAETRLERVSRPSDPDRDAPPPGGDGSGGAAGGVGGYNGIYIDAGDRVAVVNGEPRSSLVTFPANGRTPGITNRAMALRTEERRFDSQFAAYDNPENRPLGERCIVSFGSSAGPPMLPNGFYNNNYTIVQSADHVLIMTEMVHDVRMIRLGERRPLPPHVRLWFGDSWGRWEGNTLVVETTNIHPAQSAGGASLSERAKVTEWFTRQDGLVLYEFRVDDPETFAEPWGGQIPMWALDGQIYEYACHEGNYALTNILSGARYQERMESDNRGGAR